jgi:hypothetical protein
LSFFSLLIEVKGKKLKTDYLTQTGQRSQAQCLGRVGYELIDAEDL